MSKRAAIAKSDIVIVTKGCAARDVTKGSVYVVVSVVHLGVAYSHSVQVLLAGLASGRTISWYARHANRLADDEVALNDGNPTHKIKVRKSEGRTLSVVRSKASK